MPRESDSEVPSDPAAVIRELVSLLQAGVSSNAAIETLKSELAALGSYERQQFDAVWQLTLAVGAAPISVLQRLAQVFDGQFEHRQQIAVAYAAPKATARLVGLLPLVAILFAQLAGLNPLGAVSHNFVGVASVILGCAMLYFGFLWSTRLLRSAQPKPEDPAAYLELIGLAMQAGLPLAAAERQVLMFQEPTAHERNSLEKAESLSLETGAEMAGILRAAADRLRNESYFAAAKTVNHLTVQLMLPLGLTVLPAFLLLAVVPISLGLLFN